MAEVTVNVPATSANLGPGFDSLALAFSLWNKVTFRTGGTGIRIQVSGRGSKFIPTDGRNLVLRAFMQVLQRCNLPEIKHLQIECENTIPAGSGLGSSATAIVAGAMGANALLGGPLTEHELLQIAVGIEGHPDNVAAAIYGGLVLIVKDEQDYLVQHMPVPNLSAVVVTPRFRLATRQARAALPTQVPLADAVYNLGRTALVVQALRSGDLEQLGSAMQDRLHQPYRLKMIPGAEAAMQAARQAGATAVALSGAGPSLIAFSSKALAEAGGAMQQAFSRAGLEAQVFFLTASNQGAWLG